MIFDIETERRAMALFRHLLEIEPASDAALESELARSDANVAARVRGMLDSHRSTTSRIERSWQDDVPDALPARLGVYTLLGELGRGGMGMVMLGERDIAGFVQRVAIKLIQPCQLDYERCARFALERDLAARLRHPHIVQLLDCGEGPDGELWYAMELVEGATLPVHCDQRALGLRERVGLLVDLCEAVGHAHGNSILHCDIKPSNVLVTADGQLKLIDFGIAKMLDEGDGELTGDLLPMTPRYAPPELLQGQRPTTASDLWQLGAMAFEVLVGRPLRDVGAGESFAPSQRSRTVDAATPAARGLVMAQLTPALRGDLDAIVTKALRPEPGARYASADEMAADLRAWLAAQPVAARRGERGYALKRLLRAHRLANGFAALALLAVITDGVASFVQEQHTGEEACIAQSTSTFLPGSDAMLGRAVTQAAKGQHEDVLASLQAAGASLDAVEGALSQSFERLDIDHERGRQLYAPGRHAEALAVQASVLDAQSRRFGEDHPEKARQLRAELLQLRRAAGATS